MASLNPDVLKLFEVRFDDFERDDIADISGESPQLWENISGTFGITSGVLVATAGSGTRLARLLEEKPAPTSDYNSYRVLGQIPYTQLQNGIHGIIVQFEDANNYVALLVNQGANQLVLRRVEGGTPTSDMEGTGTGFDAKSFLKWTDPTTVEIHYDYDSNDMRVLINGKMITFTRASVDYEDIPLKANVQGWARKGGASVTDASGGFDTWAMSSRFGEITRPEITQLVQSSTQCGAILVAGKFLPNIASGFPADDDDRTLSSTNWEVDVWNGSSWVSFSTPTSTLPSPRALAVGGLTVGSSYRARYQFVDDNANTGDWSSYLSFTAEGAASANIEKMLSVPDSVSFYPMEPEPFLPLRVRQSWRNYVADFDDTSGTEQRFGGSDFPQRFYDLIYRSLSETQIDYLWDFYNSRKGRAQTFFFLPPEEVFWASGTAKDVALVCRFDDDSLNKDNFEAALFSTGVRLVEVL